MNIIPIELVAQRETLPEMAPASQESATHAPEGVWDLVAQSSGMVLLVLVLLALASVVSWFLIAYKWWMLSRAERQGREFLQRFWGTRELDEVEQVAGQLTATPMSAVFTGGYEELRKVVNEEGRTTHDGVENVERALRRHSVREVGMLERFLPFLATVGATAPFVGLFGTVWGIMTAFMDIARLEQAGIDVVAGPIGEALIATAVGLMAAIPAVMGYNFFMARIGRIQSEVDGFSSDFVNVVRRSLAD